MVVRSRCASYVLVGMVFATPAAHGGKIDDAGSAARGDSSTRDVPRKPHEDSGESSSSECGEACFELVRVVVLAPWSIPRELLGPHEHTSYLYADYPYRGSSRSLIHFERPSASHSFLEPESHDDARSEQTQRFAAQVDIEAGTAFDLHRAGFGLRLMLPIPVELDARWLGLWEPQQGSDDYAAFGHEHVTWRFAQSGSVQFRSGVGLQHFIENSPSDEQEPFPNEPGASLEPGLTSPQVHHVGGDFFYGFEALVGDPLVLSGQLHLGWVGQAFVWQARTTLGVMLGPVEAYGGYHHIDLGGVPLGGPAAGARLWW